MSSNVAPARPRVQAAVVGHVEWLDFAVVDRVPTAGEIVTATEVFELPAGGGAVAAVQLRKLAGRALFLTALGIDRRARRAAAELRRGHKVELHAAIRSRPQRRAFTHLDADGERTITVLGDRLVPHGDDPLPWERLAEADGVYLTGGDGAAASAARTARVLVATARAADALIAGDVAADVLVASGRDEKERAALAALPAPRHATVLTDGARGGRWEDANGAGGAWAAAELPGPPVDAYGCGDSFAAGLTYGLAAGMELPVALELAARCGAHCLTGRGPYAAQLALAPPS
ncbi:MAG TPA: PfkB family carbohydrate kinase [Conexibacter sp.]|nr:PfkB family carbohydrate kinase [Conexibacter sp.]